MCRLIGANIDGQINICNYEKLRTHACIKHIPRLRILNIVCAKELDQFERRWTNVIVYIFYYYSEIRYKYYIYRTKWNSSSTSVALQYVMVNVAIAIVVYSILHCCVLYFDSLS
jgi:hypothetical protein